MAQRPWRRVPRRRLHRPRRRDRGQTCRNESSEAADQLGPPHLPLPARLTPAGRAVQQWAARPHPRTEARMRYFLDTEFIERPGTIDLISIGIVSEDRREFYAES